MEPISARVAAAVEVIRKRIQQVRDRKELIGEQNTKAALIDPLLTAMGWELQEIDEVRREIVDYMCSSVEKALHEEFEYTLASPEVVILDPCTG